MNKTQRRDKMVEERTAYWAKKRPSWLRQPLARVQNPLKFIREATVEIVQDAKGNWVQRNSKDFYSALDCARVGLGYHVQAMALRLAAKK